MKTAVIVIDMVEESFSHPGLLSHRSHLCKSINALLETQRKRGAEIIWVWQEFAPDLSDAFLDMKEEGIFMFIQDTPGVETVSELKRDPNELQVIKKRFSALFGTNLETLLTDRKIERLVLVGVNSHACIRMTAIDAYQRDWKVLIPKECVASYDSEFHRETLRYLAKGSAEIVSLKDL